MATGRGGRSRGELAREGGERFFAATAHGAIAFGFLGIGFLLSLAITAVIWLVSRRSTYVREQSDRAGLYQLFVLAVNILAIGLWVLGLALLLWLTGWRFFGFGGGDPQVARGALVTAVIAIDLILLIVAAPLFVAWYVGTILYGLYGMVQALAGRDFRYPPAPWGRRKRRLELERERAARAEEEMAEDSGGDEEVWEDNGEGDEWDRRRLRW